MINRTPEDAQHPDLHYTSLFEAMPGSFLLFKNDAPRYTILAATPEYLIQTGTTKEGLIGRGVFEAFPGNPRDRTDTGSFDLKASLEHVSRTKESHHLPGQRYDVIGEHGHFSERYWRISNNPVFSPNGEVACILNIVSDITNEVKAASLEQQMRGLEESEYELRNMVLHAPVGICVLDAATMVISIVDDSFVEIAGRPIHEIIGWKYWDTFADARPYYEEALNKVIVEGTTFRANKVEVPLLRHGKREILNVTFVYEPVRDASGALRKVVVWVLDNTKQLNASRHAEESEEKYQRLFNSIDDGFCTIDVLFNEAGKPFNYRLLEVNNAFQLQTGLTEAVGRTMNDFAILEDFWYETYGKVAVTGEAVRFESRAENLHRYYDVYAFKVGRPAQRQVAVLFTDITKRKNAEQKLQETADLLQTVFNSAPNGIAVMQPIYTTATEIEDFSILLFNNYTLNWIGNVEYKGKRYGEVFPMVKETGILERFKEVMRSGIPQTFERWYTGEGMKHWFRFTVVKQEDLLVVTTEDITQQKVAEKSMLESEKRFRTLADESPIFVFLIEPDPVASVSYWNKTWLDYTGQTLEEAKGRSWEGIIHPDDIQLVMDIYTLAYKNKQPYFIPAVRTKRKDGAYRWHSFKGNPRYFADGRFNGYAGVGFDVHEQQLSRERLEAMVSDRTKELERSNEDLQHFAHVASHDLQEPVRKIRTFVGRLEEEMPDLLNEKSSRYLGKIKSATARMYSMIDGVLSYSKIGSTAEITRQVDLQNVIRSIETDLEVKIEKTGAVIHYSNLPHVEGAPVLIYQLFYNLINNSLKFAKDDLTPVITFRYRNIMVHNNEFVEIILKDNGIGFRQEQGEMIFEIFTRLHSKDKYEGTGLGLSLCKKIVERHGGSITAQGTPDAGAIFIIRLPAKQKRQEV